MGALTPYLQNQFAQHCPAGWQCRKEVALLDSTLERLMGYASRADVLLENLEEQSRVWIEFEVSRADPVANHAKFATAHLFCPWSERDTFVAMVSSHVSRGRRNLAANTIGLMRQLGIQAFQTCLFPKLNPVQIQHYNHLDVQRFALSSIRQRRSNGSSLSEIVLPTAHKGEFIL